MPRHQVNGCLIHYQQYASAAKEPVSTVIFLHGLGSSIRDWSDQIPALIPFYNVLLVDLRGHGQSDKPLGPYSIQQMSCDIYTLANELELNNVHCVGLSMGAQVALQLALDYPAIVASVVAVNSPANMKPKRLQDKIAILQRRILVNVLGMRKVGQIIAKRLLPGDAFIDRRQVFAERWAENDTASYNASFNAIINWDITSELPNLRRPILVIAAREDYTPLAWKERIVELAPDANIVIIENSRHATPVERPEEFNAVLLAFLRAQYSR